MRSLYIVISLHHVWLFLEMGVLYGGTMHLAEDLWTEADLYMGLPQPLFEFFHVLLFFMGELTCQ